MKKTGKRKLFTGILIAAMAVGSLFNLRTTVKAEEQNTTVTKNSSVRKKITQKNTNFSVQTELGIDGYVAYDIPILTKITVKSEENFVGSIRVTPITEDIYLEVVAYGEDVVLAAGETKTFSFVPSSLGEGGGIKVELFDEQENVVYAETDTVKTQTIYLNDVLLGILSDDYTALNYFDGLDLLKNSDDGEVTTLELKVDDFPTQNEALTSVDAIIVSNCDTAKLSDEQYTALKEWVNQGGILILSLGANYQNVLSRFDDNFVTGTLGNVSKKDITWLIDPIQTKEVGTQRNETTEQEEVTTEAKIKKVDVVEFDLEGEEVLSTFSGNETAVKKQCGRGYVVVLAYDLGMEPIIGSENREDIAKQLIDEINMIKNMGSATWYGDIDEVIKKLNNNQKPSTVLFGVVLVIYTLVVGPVLYYLFKKKGKREKLWVAVPAMSLVFTGIIYLLGTKYRVNKPLVGTLTVVSLENNAKKEEVHLGITCPKAKSYRFKMNPEYGKLKCNEYYGYEYDFLTTGNNIPYDVLVNKTNGGTEITLHNRQTFETQQLTLEKVTDNDIGELALDLHCYTDGVSGTITNQTNYDLEHIIVNFERNYYLVGDIKPGESVTFEKEDRISGTNNMYDPFSSSYYIAREQSADVTNYHNYIIDTWMANQYVTGETGEGNIWGNIKGYTVDVVENDDGNKYGKEVLYMTFTGKYEDVKGSYISSIREVMISGSDGYDGEMMSGTETVTYSFEEYPEITTLKLESDVEADADYVYADIYAMNGETGEYEQIFKDSDTLTGTQLKKYLVNHVLQLQYVEKDTGKDSYIPKISARGDK